MNKCTWFMGESVGAEMCKNLCILTGILTYDDIAQLVSQSINFPYSV